MYLLKLTILLSHGYGIAPAAAAVIADRDDVWCPGLRIAEDVKFTKDSTFDQNPNQLEFAYGEDEPSPDAKWRRRPFCVVTNKSWFWARTVMHDKKYKNKTVQCLVVKKEGRFKGIDDEVLLGIAGTKSKNLKIWPNKCGNSGGWAVECRDGGSGRFWDRSAANLACDMNDQVAEDGVHPAWYDQD